MQKLLLLAKLVYRMGRIQSQNLAKLLRGEMVQTPAFSSMTLEPDDIRLVKKWLGIPDKWREPASIQAYEERFAQWNGNQYAFAFMGGRVALSACIHALDLKPGDEVIVPGYTCVVVPNAFKNAGVEVVYADIELETFGLEASAVERKITCKTRAILLHHLYGLVCRDYEKLLALAEKHGLRIIEDCAHAAGAEFRGRKVGTYGDVAFFSSERSKVFSTVMGGIAVTSDQTLSGRMREYAEAAKFPDDTRIRKQLENVILDYYQFKHPLRWFLGEPIRTLYQDTILEATSNEEEKGIKPADYGLRMPAPVADLGLNQLEKLDAYNERRRKSARKWDSWCENKGYAKPLVIEDSLPVFLRYPVLVEEEKKKDRNWVMKELGVTAGVWFISHLHPASGRVEGCPHADRAISECINLPCLWNVNEKVKSISN